MYCRSSYLFESPHPSSPLTLSPVAGRPSPVRHPLHLCTGITMFCTLTTVCWMSPPDTTLSMDLMPWYLYLPASIVVFFNGTCSMCVCVCVCVCVCGRGEREERFVRPRHITYPLIRVVPFTSFLLTVQLLTTVCTVVRVAHVCVCVCGGHWRRRHTGQYYAQRVIGNYYIRKAQDYQKRGITRVDLHAS